MSQNAESPDARRDDVDGIVTITFTRDHKLNSVTPAMFALLESAVTSLEEDDACRVLVIRAEGRYFTAGVDITTMSPDLGLGTDGVVRGSTMRRQYRAGARHDLFDRLEAVEKPVVLAAHAACLGVGVEMGASCDFRLASDAATFSLPEVQNLALIPGSGGVSRLSRLVGPHWAKWFALAGMTVSAEKAMMIGFVHEVYPAAEFDEAVTAFAQRLAGLPREAVGVAKLAIDAAADVDRRTAREIDRLAQSLLFSSPEYLERLKRFQKR